MHPLTENKSKINPMQIVSPYRAPHHAYLFLILTLMILLRLIPIYFSPLPTYGYDFGFYLHALKQTSSALDWSSLSAALRGEYLNPLLAIINSFHPPLEQALSLLMFVSSIAAGLAFYFYFRKSDPKAGILAVILMSLSITQAEVYTMFLLKTSLALPFLILSFKFLQEKKYPTLLLCAGAIAVLHRTTLIILLLSFGGYLFYILAREKKFLLLSAIGLAAAAALISFDEQILRIISILFSYKNERVMRGIFLENHNLALTFLPYLLIAAPGLIRCVKRKEHLIWLVLVCLLIIWIILKLPFYRRLLLYLELTLVFFSSYFWAGWLTKKKVMIGAIVSILLLTMIHVKFVFAKKPLISEGEIQEVKNFRKIGFILSTSAADVPWLLGYAENNQVAGPGLFASPQTLEDWQMFWSGENQKEFLSSYPRPVYLYTRHYLPSNLLPDCLQKYSQNFYQIICQLP